LSRCVICRDGFVCADWPIDKGIRAVQLENQRSLVLFAASWNQPFEDLRRNHLTERSQKGCVGIEGRARKDTQGGGRILEIRRSTAGNQAWFWTDCRNEASFKSKNQKH